MHLYETGLPCRYYLPPPSVDTTLLVPSETRTQCPYKGEAQYFSIDLGKKKKEEEGDGQGGDDGDGGLYKDLVWYYQTTTLESSPVAGMVCFYNEKVDIELDGEEVERPETVFGGKKK